MHAKIPNVWLWHFLFLVATVSSVYGSCFVLLGSTGVIGALGALITGYRSNDGLQTKYN